MEAKGNGKIIFGSDIQKVEFGMRILGFVDGHSMKKYLPEVIMDNVHLALKDREMPWDDATIGKCTMKISRYSASVLYRYDYTFHNGLLLFSFSLSPEKKHRFDFPLKHLHLDRYGRNSKY
jgi:hypothetical protein